MRHHSRLANTRSFQMIAFTAICALSATFILANSELGVGQRAVAFVSIVALFLAVCFVIYRWQSARTLVVVETDGIEEAFNEGTVLKELEEAGQILAGSIKLGDMFRLVCSRINTGANFRCCELLLLDETRSHLYVAVSEGQNVELSDRLVYLDENVAGKSFTNGAVGFGHTVSASTGDELDIAIIPLEHGKDIFGLIRLYFDPAQSPTEKDGPFLRSMGIRVAPLILSSIAFERSLSNALTDGITDLPNERAFHLILENQVAETQRNHGDRPLTILAMDIKRFDELNRRFGHDAGDRALNFAAQTIKDNLRQMDFLARSVDDEYLAVLPTASIEITHEIIARIGTSFVGQMMELSQEGEIEIELNFGWSAYGTDGETPRAILAAARLRKDQAKSVEPKRILWFPKDLVN